MLLDFDHSATADDQSLAAFVTAGNNHVVVAQRVITSDQIREIAFAERRAVVERFGEFGVTVEARADVHFHVRHARRMPAKKILDLVDAHGARLEKRLVRVDLFHIEYSITL